MSRSDIAGRHPAPPGYKQVRIDVTFSLVREVPEDLDEEQCRFHFEENYCVDNIANDLGNAVDASPGICVCCPIANVEYLGK